MLFYINETYKHGWSRAMVLNQIETKAYERSLIEPSTTDIYKSYDLLMYHTKIHSYVVIEVKIGEFNPSYLGQLIFYVNTVDTLEKTDRDDPTIGLLLCKDADKFIAETTLKNSLMKLGISKYKILEELPEYLERRLNEKNEDSRE